MVHRKIRRYSYLKKMKMNRKDSSIILMQKINFYYVKYFSYSFIINASPTIGRKGLFCLVEKDVSYNTEKKSN